MCVLGTNNIMKWYLIKNKIHMTPVGFESFVWLVLSRVTYHSAVP